jgi:hypothetical protein
LAIRSRVQRLERGARENSDSFELTDGSTHYYDPTSGALFLHCCECLRRRTAGEPFSPAPATVRALCRARDRGAVIERVVGDSLFPYDLQALSEHGQLVPAEWIKPLEDHAE